MLACMAGPLNTGQQFMTYLFIQFFPIIIFILCFLAYPTNNLATTISKTAPWRLWGNSCIFDVKESRNTRNLLESCKTKPKGKRFELTCSRPFFSPSRLVVALRFFSNVSQVPPPGTLPTWLFKVKRRFDRLHRWSDLILTPTLFG
jgi:hypothetical protein